MLSSRVCTTTGTLLVGNELLQDIKVLLLGMGRLGSTQILPEASMELLQLRQSLVRVGVNSNN